jgi:hypothetical protein
MYRYIKLIPRTERELKNALNIAKDVIDEPNEHFFDHCAAWLTRIDNLTNMFLTKHDSQKLLRQKHNLAKHVVNNSILYALARMKSNNQISQENLIEKLYNILSVAIQDYGCTITPYQLVSSEPYHNVFMMLVNVLKRNDQDSVFASFVKLQLPATNMLLYHVDLYITLTKHHHLPKNIPTSVLQKYFNTIGATGKELYTFEREIGKIEKIKFTPSITISNNPDRVPLIQWICERVDNPTEMLQKVCTYCLDIGDVFYRKFDTVSAPIISLLVQRGAVVDTAIDRINFRDDLSKLLDYVFGNYYIDKEGTIMRLLWFVIMEYSAQFSPKYLQLITKHSSKSVKNYFETENNNRLLIWSALIEKRVELVQKLILLHDVDINVTNSLGLNFVAFAKDINNGVTQEVLDIYEHCNRVQIRHHTNQIQTISHFIIK